MGFLEGFGKKLGVLNYQGTWNAQTNTPTLLSSSGKKGQYYIVSASGSTALDGISTWETGDWVIHNGSNWQKMDAADKEKMSQLESQINAEITARQTADAAKVDSANATADGYKISQAAFVTKTSSYTLTSSENGKVVLVNSASAVTITVPSGLSVGFSCTVVQLGAGQVTIAASGTTLNSVSGLKIVGQHGAASVISYDTNIFNVSGATTAW